jgi:FSR family fosmidomycin resistance protein-like MFS transporter
VLVLGVLGQYAAGRTARPSTLEPMIAAVFLAAAPCLAWMGMAAGAARIWAAAIFAPVFFMHQPLLNSLVAKYVPRRRRGLAYGLSFTVGFGMGSIGSAFAGKVESAWGGSGPLVNYTVLAGLTLVVSFLCALLWRRHRAKGCPVELPPAPWDDAQPTV